MQQQQQQRWQQESWIDRTAHADARVCWRAVEAQHLVATLRLVDDLHEQELLEQILEASKPALPRGLRALHYLLSTPFRYASPHPSRFRRADAPGIWYGASDRRTACAEVGYWRWRFLSESHGLRNDELITEHTLFQARVAGRCIDLCAQPWTDLAPLWTDRSDYSSCHELADQARVLAVQWIAYQSVRNPPGRCAAVLDATALALHQPTRQETWAAKVSAEQVMFSHDRDRYSFQAVDWRAN